MSVQDLPSANDVAPQVEHILNEYEKELASLEDEAQQLILQYQKDLETKKISEVRTRLAEYEKH